MAIASRNTNRHGGSTSLKRRRKQSYFTLILNETRRTDKPLSGDSDNVDISGLFSTYSSEFSGSFQNSNDGSGDTNSAVRSTSFTINTRSSSGRRARNTPLQARTSDSKSKNAASIVQELNQLKFDKQDLYGREEELQMLFDAYRRLGMKTNKKIQNCKTTNDRSPQNIEGAAHISHKEPMNMVLLEGLSGAGKSALAKEFKRRLTRCAETSPAMFASGKFDQLHHQRAPKPYSAFTTAFVDLCGQFSAQNVSPEENPLRRALSEDYLLLADLIPNLTTELCFDENTMNDNFSKDSSSTFGKMKFDIVKSQRRFQYAVRTFLCTICDRDHPTVLFLDDLHWADQPSLDMLKDILLEPRLQHSMLVIGSCRSNEVDDNHPLTRQIKAMENDRKQLAVKIPVLNLSLDHVNQLISDLFNLNPGETLLLAEIAQKKVQGNAFSLIQFLTALRDSGLIEYNIGTMKWTWELNNIRKSTVVSNNVLEYLMQRMKLLPDSMRRILLIASCLGSSFDEEVVTALAEGLGDSDLVPSASDKNAEDILIQLEEEGILESFEAKDGRSSFCFVHAQIEVAARSLQDDNAIHLLKLKMAKILYEKREQLDFSGNLFLIVDLWNESREMAQQNATQAEDDRTLIDLNQMAGKRGLDVAAFNAAIHYFRSAISLIPVDLQWTDQYYAKSLALYNSLIKAEFSAGSWEHLSKNINAILKQKDRPVLDMIVAYTVQIAVLSFHESKLNEAISLAVDVLDKLGIKFRPSLGKLAVVGSLIKTKKLLKKIPLESILNRSPMDMVHKKVGMNIFSTVTSSLYAANPDLYMTGVLKILRWSLKYGTTKHTSRAIGLYGLVETALGNLEGGTKACTIALQLAEEQGILTSEYAPTASVYGFVFPWTRPMHTCQKRLYEGYKVGLQTGDMEYAVMNIVLYGFFCYSTGKPLSNLEADMRDYAEQMKECRMLQQLKFLSLTWQTILNLLGRSKDPLVLTGEAMDRDKTLAGAEIENDPPLKAQLYCHELQLAVYLCDFTLASSLLKHTSCIGAVNPANPIIWRTALFEGITAFEMAQQGNKKYRAVGTKSLKKVKGWVDQGNPNCVHILYLLQAEKFHCDGSIEEARSHYDKSILIAARNGFLSDRALANERCGRMYQRTKDEYWTTEYFHRAYDIYVELEARVKVEQLQKVHKSFRPSEGFSLSTEQSKITRDKFFNRTFGSGDLPSTVFTVDTEGMADIHDSSAFLGLEEETPIPPSSELRHVPLLQRREIMMRRSTLQRQKRF
ncbi:multi-sensor signal transduction multi-kinase [Nitzschia inconspicua]|uniref:Multi-sensor signal transduction multi-kinase n=1 Tax=Nitzschia inconspicua TaxID=303405 RepID=A0A9K3PXY5_9STRA|nr:multi-sensor signal transduction multi-kinase [Nitzschia inconspicua]